MPRPKVVVHASASVDGRIAISPDVPLLFDSSKWQAVQGGESPVDEWLKLTHKPGATLEGSGSFVPDSAVPDPLQAVEGDSAALYDDYLPDAVVNRPGHQGWFTVVDGRGRVRWLYKEYPDEAWAGWHLLVLVAQTTPPEYLAYLQREQIPYLVAGREHVDLEQALEKLHARLGVTSLLSTAGGKLNGALLQAGLVDEINVEFIPAIIGGAETPSLFSGLVLPPDAYPIRLNLLSAQVQDSGRVWLRYTVSDQEK